MPEHRKHLLILAEYQRVSSAKEETRQFNEKSLRKVGNDVAQQTVANKPHQ